ncbi:MAG: DUF2339 domain-containing protein [Chloroflexi bacterium]|nr:DUF2339 domain-containing protein [Chloroflexota bacterium]
MVCLRCHRESPLGSRSCSFCGSRFSLQEQITALGQVLQSVSDRLASVERSLGTTVPGAAAQAPGPPVQEVIPVAPSEAPAAVEAAEPPPGEALRQGGRGWDWEAVLGGNWLARIGVLALVIGVGFFLKLAFDNNWIGPTARVTLGLLGGIALLGAGEYWQRRYPPFAQALTGGGIALLYLSIFAAFAIFHLISLLPAWGFLLLVSMASAVLAVRHEAMALAVIGILGAFGAPFILGGFAPAAREAATAGPGFELLAYILVVDVGVLALSALRNWRWFTLLALVGSLAVFGLWNEQLGRDVSLLVPEVGLTLIFLVFVGATTLFHVVWRRAPRTFDQLLMVANAAAYFGISYGLLWDHFRVWMGGFSLLLALFYGGLAYAVLLRSAANARLGLLALGTALVFLTIAVPVQLGDQAWTTAAWAAEGVVLTWLSFTLRMPTLRPFAFGVFAVMAVRLLFFDTAVELRTFRPLLNERFLAFVFGIAATYTAAYLLWRGRGDLQPWEQEAFTLYPLFLVAASFFSLWVLTAEVLSYFDSRIAATARLGGVGWWQRAEALRDGKNLSLTGLWALYAAVLLVVGFARRSRLVRLAGLGLLVVPIAKVFVYDVFTLERVYRIVAFIGLGVLLLAGGYLYQRYGRAIRGYVLGK